jgi:ABC-type ATPase with predicted acetyltransferase domain
MTAKLLPESVEVFLQSPVSDSFRCKLAANSLDIDVAKKSIHHLKISGIKIPGEWSVGIIYGASGSGKTTLAKKIFGEDVFKIRISNDLPIIEQFAESYTYDECSAMLNGIGLTSVPCWIRPVSTLSNGQRVRAEAALLMSQPGMTVIDEWTSVVDRTVAKAMSHCVQKYAKRNNKQIILLSCHADIIEWVNPDWIIDCNSQEFKLPNSNEFFFAQKNNLYSTSGPLTEVHGNNLASIII